MPSPALKAPAEEQTADHDWFRQTEYVPLLPFGLWRKKVIFENWYKDLPDIPVVTIDDAVSSTPGVQRKQGGVEAKIYAPGVTIEAFFKVEQCQPDFLKDTITSRGEDKAQTELGKWQVVEETKMKCKNVVVKWLSVGQQRRAQTKMLDSIVHEAEKRAYGDNGQAR